MRGFRKITILLVCCLFAMAGSFNVYANERELARDDRMLNASADIFPVENYTYSWRVISKSVSGYSFGNWRKGPTGRGPGSLSINEGSTLNRNFTNTISGAYSWGEGNIGLSLGVSIGKSETHGTSYTIQLNKGQIKTILLRPKIKIYRVVTGYYKLPVNAAGRAKLIKKETSYVRVFNGWDYSWKSGY
ncbi:hypothetical protein [Oribacterium sp. oral taxon 078]|uniref:hypothetical protein n=1 Tax=Oribacterium sp. oral taxon 078 TaxID=652706 RepID=UPI0012DE2B52|nr:hypothetical protein [Oribacterium sp. oral taxon 078]